MPHDPRGLAAYYESDAKHYDRMGTPGAKALAADLRQGAATLRAQADREAARRACFRCVACGWTWTARDPVECPMCGNEAFRNLSAEAGA